MRSWAGSRGGRCPHALGITGVAQTSNPVSATQASTVRRRAALCAHESLVETRPALRVRVSRITRFPDEADARPGTREACTTRPAGGSSHRKVDTKSSLRARRGDWCTRTWRTMVRQATSCRSGDKKSRDPDAAGPRSSRPLLPVMNDAADGRAWMRTMRRQSSPSASPSEA